MIKGLKKKLVFFVKNYNLHVTHPNRFEQISERVCVTFSSFFESKFELFKFQRDVFFELKPQFIRHIGVPFFHLLHLGLIFFL